MTITGYLELQAAKLEREADRLREVAKRRRETAQAMRNSGFGDAEVGELSDGTWYLVGATDAVKVVNTYG